MIVALLLHAAVIMGITFKPSNDRQYTRQIEVTLATTASPTAPDEAALIAPSNQSGQGDTAQREQFADAPKRANSAPAQALGRASRKAPAAEQNLVATSAPSSNTVKRIETIPRRSNQRDNSASGEIDRLTREIASLEAELSRNTPSQRDNSRIRRLSDASAKQSVDAAYLLDWRRRLEAVGNQYYPSASVRYGIYGDLRMLVVIRADGSLEEIRLLSSSGYAVLDEAAIKIVRMAAPYAPFPSELKATTDKLEIVRTWHFQENQLSSP